MTPQGVAEALEGKREGHEWRCRCPVHGGRSLSVTERDGRLLVTCRAGCLQNEVIKALRELGLWGNDARYETHPPEAKLANEIVERKAERAADIWRQSRPIQPGDPAHKYLTGRGIVLDAWPGDLRTHPQLDYWEAREDGKPVRTGVFPAMLAVVRSPSGRPVGLHRTYITEDGHKASVLAPRKLMKVRDLTGSAVRLFPPRDGFLAVAEGVEDALSAWILWGLPCWAVLGTSGLKGFIPPEDVQEVWILADRDENGAGQRAAVDLAQRLEDMKKAVRILVPSGPAKDINQLLMMESTR